jgi:hypothetical protein
MSAEFDKEAKQEYLDAIQFYGKAAERFSEALAACIQKIQGGIANSVSTDCAKY